MSNVCAERMNNQPHCWHTTTAPIIQPGVSASFPSVCCFCAPEWMHIEVYVLGAASTEDIEAANMMHGPLVQMNKRPTTGPSLMVPGR